MNNSRISKIKSKKFRIINLIKIILLKNQLKMYIYLINFRKIQILKWPK